MLSFFQLNDASLIVLHLNLIGGYYVFFLLLVLLFDLTNLLLSIGSNYLQVLLDGVVKMEIDGGEILMDNGGEFDGVSGLSEFSDGGSSQLYQFLMEG